MVSKEKKLFKGDWANENVLPENYIFNDFLTNQSHESNYFAIRNGGKADKAYECDLCHAQIAWAYYFNNIKTGKKIIAGIECAKIIDSGVNAIDYQKAKRIQAEKLKFTYEENVEKFKKEFSILYQGAEFFKDYDFVIQNIFNNVKYGLTEKQIAYLKRLIVEAWEMQVAKYKTEFFPKPPAPKLKAGVHELEVTISNYYYQDKKYYGIEKAVFETEAGHTIFTGKTQQLVQSLEIKKDLFEDDFGVANFWALDKKERKSWLTGNKNYFDKGTKGILEIELGDEFAEDKYGGKIINFIPTYTKNKNVLQ